MTLVGVAAPSFFGETVRPNPAGFWMPLARSRCCAAPRRSSIARLALALRDRPDHAGRDSGRDQTRVRPWRCSSGCRGSRSLAERRSAGSPQQRDRRRPGRRRRAAHARQLRAVADAAVRDVGARAADCGGQPRQPAAGARRSRAGGGARRARRVAAGWSASRSPKASSSRSPAALAALVVATAATRAILALAFPARRCPVDARRRCRCSRFRFAWRSSPARSSPPRRPGRCRARTDRRAARPRPKAVTRSFVPRRSLVIVQVTLSLVLLASAGLLTKSLSRLERQPLGFDPDTGSSSASIRRPRGRRRGSPRSINLCRTAAARAGRRERELRALQPDGRQQLVERHLHQRPACRSRPAGRSSWNRVSPHYFETVGTRVVRGRVFTSATRRRRSTSRSSTRPSPSSISRTSIRSASASASAARATPTTTRSSASSRT